MDHNVVGWFEVPVADMERAMTFYKAIGFELERHKMGELDMAWFPMQQDTPGAAGALVQNDWYTPSEEGTLVYFTTPSGDLDKDAEAIEAAGGEIVVEKKSIGEHGFIMVAKDTEGNRIAFHAMK